MQQKKKRQQTQVVAREFLIRYKEKTLHGEGD